MLRLGISKIKYICVFVILGVLCCLITAPLLSGSRQEIKRIKVFNIPNRIAILATSGDSLVVAGKNNIMYVWDWKDLNREPRTTKIENYHKPAAYMAGDLVLEARDVPLEANDIITYDYETRYGIKQGKFTETNVIVLRDFESGREYRRWDLTNYWYLDGLSVSRNGKYVVVQLSGNRSPNISKMRLAVISSETPEKLPIFDIDGKNKPNIDVQRGLAISDDGCIIAHVSNRKEKITLYDAKTGKVLWAKSPKNSGTLDYVQFTPDGKRVYTTGSFVYVFGFEVATGEMIFHGESELHGELSWPSDPTGLSISPDGRWLVSGRSAASGGRLCLWDIKSGECVIRQNTRAGTFAFSPDSRFFASRGPETGDISIYEIPVITEK